MRLAAGLKANSTVGAQKIAPIEVLYADWAVAPVGAIRIRATKRAAVTRPTSLFARSSGKAKNWPAAKALDHSGRRIVGRRRFAEFRQLALLHGAPDMLEIHYMQLNRDSCGHDLRTVARLYPPEITAKR
jgi:hypothetical protein